MNHNGYKTYFFQSDIRRAQLGLGILLVPIIGFILNDYALFASSQMFYGILALRIVMAISTLLMLLPNYKQK